MKKNIGLVAIVVLIHHIAFADEISTPQQGVQQYDWQTCIAQKTSDCTNSCSQSENIDCGNDCDTLAKDKCTSLGLTPPG